MDAILAFVKQILEGQGGQYQIIGQVLMVVGALRLLFKPLMSLALAYVQMTPNVEDDSKLAKIMDSQVYKILAYVLDWSASIKLPNKEVK